MSIRKTVTFDDDVVARITRESKLRGASFGDTLNDLLRSALLEIDNSPNRRTIIIKPTHMGYKRGPGYDSIESLIEYGGGAAQVTNLRPTPAAGIRPGFQNAIRS
jgi:hypothetical protein